MDGAGLAGGGVSIDKAKSTVWVAVKQGVLHRAYVYHTINSIQSQIPPTI